jgi:hypothetical protein
MDRDFSAPVAQTDALGGAGSISPSLHSIAVNGLSRAVDGSLSQKFPLTSFNETYAANRQGAFEPGGVLAPSGAPSSPTLIAPAAPAFSSPLLWGVIAGVAIVLVVVAVMK